MTNFTSMLPCIIICFAVIIAVHLFVPMEDLFPIEPTEPSGISSSELNGTEMLPDGSAPGETTNPSSGGTNPSENSDTAKNETTPSGSNEPTGATEGETEPSAPVETQPLETKPQPTEPTEPAEPASPTEPTTEPTEPEETAMPTELQVKIQNVNETVYATSTVNVRSGPGTSYEKLGQLTKDAAITRTGICDNGWSRVEFNGEIAYISSSYLTKTTPETTEPPATDISGVSTTEAELIWKYNNPTLTETNEVLYAHWYSIAVYDRMPICTDVQTHHLTGIQYFYTTTSGNVVGEIGLNESVICTGRYENGWFRIVYQGEVCYTKPEGYIVKFYSEPIVFTYKDGTTSTELKDGATYIDDNGNQQTYETEKDDAGREAGTICEICGKEIARWNTEGIYCTQFATKDTCTKCGETVEPFTCHTCKNYDVNTYYCSTCGKLCGDGTNGTCVYWLTGGNHTCPNCGDIVPGGQCHTCDEE